MHCVKAERGHSSVFAGLESKISLSFCRFLINENMPDWYPARMSSWGKMARRLLLSSACSNFSISFRFPFTCTCGTSSNCSSGGKAQSNGRSYQTSASAVIQGLGSKAGTPGNFNRWASMSFAIVGSPGGKAAPPTNIGDRPEPVVSLSWSAKPPRKASCSSKSSILLAVLPMSAAAIGPAAIQCWQNLRKRCTTDCCGGVKVAEASKLGGDLEGLPKWSQLRTSTITFTARWSASSSSPSSAYTSIR